jgi:hypothetical protein
VADPPGVGGARVATLVGPEGSSPLLRDFSFATKRPRRSPVRCYHPASLVLGKNMFRRTRPPLAGPVYSKNSSALGAEARRSMVWAQPRAASREYLDG